MRLDDFIYRHNGGWWVRTSETTSAGPYPNESAVIDAFVDHMSSRNPVALVVLALQGKEAMGENIHQNKDGQFYYKDFEEDECVGPFFDREEAMKSMLMRAEQIHTRDTEPRKTTH